MSELQDPEAEQGGFKTQRLPGKKMMKTMKQAIRKGANKLHEGETFDNEEALEKAREEHKRK